jgi:hypothetical protein
MVTTSATKEAFTALNRFRYFRKQPKHTQLSNDDFRVNFATKHLYQTNNPLHFTIQTLTNTPGHSLQKSKHANDKLFSYLQEAYLWVKAKVSVYIHCNDCR